MILDAASTSRLIEGYKRLLLRVAGPPARPTVTVLEHLIVGRKKLLANRSLLAATAALMQAESRGLDQELLETFASLDFKKWVYLRDTKIHSIFVDPDGRSAFGVVGLTNPICDLIGGTGALIETGLLRFQGKYVCDGLISELVWLGPDYKKDFSDMLSEIKSNGGFSSKYPVQSTRPAG